jgi:hypothetical protein
MTHDKTLEGNDTTKEAEAYRNNPRSHMHIFPVKWINLLCPVKETPTKIRNVGQGPGGYSAAW